MTKIYVSFGQIHSCVTTKKSGGYVTLDRNCIAVLKCETYEKGREIIVKITNNMFHNCWSEKEWKEEWLKYFPRGLIEI